MNRRIAIGLILLVGLSVVATSIALPHRPFIGANPFLVFSVILAFLSVFTIAAGLLSGGRPR